MSNPGQQSRHSDMRQSGSFRTAKTADIVAMAGGVAQWTTGPAIICYSYAAGFVALLWGAISDSFDSSAHLEVFKLDSQAGELGLLY